MFSCVAVNLEEGDVREERGCDFQDMGAVLGERAADGGTSYDATELENADAT